MRVGGLLMLMVLVLMVLVAALVAWCGEVRRWRGGTVAHLLVLRFIIGSEADADSKGVDSISARFVFLFSSAGPFPDEA